MSVQIIHVRCFLPKQDEKATETDEDCTDAENVTDLNAGASLPQDTGKTTEALDATLQKLPPRYAKTLVQIAQKYVVIVECLDVFFLF